MHKKICLTFICIIIACTYSASSFAETTKKLPYDIVTFIDEQLENIKGASYYDCVRDEIYAKVAERLTDEEIAAANYYGEPDMPYIKGVVGALAKVGSTISEVFHTSPCMPQKNQ